MRHEAEAEAGRRPVQGFEDLVAWQRARLVVRAINELLEGEALARKFGFRDQLQRAAISVMSNIAEGFERGSRAEFFHFLSIAKGSCAEVRSLLFVALDAGYIDDRQFQILNHQVLETSKIIGGLRASVRRQRDDDRRGTA